MSDTVVLVQEYLRSLGFLLNETAARQLVETVLANEQVVASEVAQLRRAVAELEARHRRAVEALTGSAPAYAPTRVMPAFVPPDRALPAAELADHAMPARPSGPNSVRAPYRSSLLDPPEPARPVASAQVAPEPSPPPAAAPEPEPARDDETADLLALVRDRLGGDAPPPVELEPIEDDEEEERFYEARRPAFGRRGAPTPDGPPAFGPIEPIMPPDDPESERRRFGRRKRRL